MTLKFNIALLILSLSQCWSWENLPQIPTGRRSQYLVLHENGGYKYGYDTGDGSAAKQSGDASNQVEGHYFYKNAAGQNIDLKYSAGVQGFVPESFPADVTSTSHNALPLLPTKPQYIATPYTLSDDQANTGDASYAFNIDTDTYKRKESSDAQGNIKGSYSYRNEAGIHDLSYVAGENTGFVATSGSLSEANGLKSKQMAQTYHGTPQVNSYSHGSPASTRPLQSNVDGSYSYAYSTGDLAHQQSSDATGNVQGSYSYKNNDGNHDLSYVAGSKTGFLVTGGSLAQPNGLGSSAPSYNPVSAAKSVGFPAATTSFPTLLAPVSGYNSLEDQANTGDSSYSFSIDTDEYKRHENADASGNVQGSYSYKNAAGTHDLSYVAGSKTGFIATGGSLSNPELATKLTSNLPTYSTRNTYLPPTTDIATDLYSGETENDLSNTGDASYSFSIDTDEYKRLEAADVNGNIKGSYSYKNAAGTHDLSYVAGSATGFKGTGGTLSVAPGLSESQLRAGSSQGSSYILSKSHVDLPKIKGFIHSTPLVNSFGPSTKTAYTLDNNVVVHTYLPPSNDKKKFGYILDTKY